MLVHSITRAQVLLCHLVHVKNYCNWPLSSALLIPRASAAASGPHLEHSNISSLRTWSALIVIVIVSSTKLPFSKNKLQLKMMKLDNISPPSYTRWSIGNNTAMQVPHITRKYFQSVFQTQAPTQNNVPLTDRHFLHEWHNQQQTHCFWSICTDTDTPTSSYRLWHTHLRQNQDVFHAQCEAAELEVRGEEPP